MSKVQSVVRRAISRTLDFGFFFFYKSTRGSPLRPNYPRTSRIVASGSKRTTLSKLLAEKYKIPASRSILSSPRDSARRQRDVESGSPLSGSGAPLTCALVRVNLEDARPPTGLRLLHLQRRDRVLEGVESLRRAPLARGRRVLRVPVGVRFRISVRVLSLHGSRPSARYSPIGLRRRYRRRRRGLTIK